MLFPDPFCSASTQLRPSVPGAASTSPPSPPAPPCPFPPLPSAKPRSGTGHGAVAAEQMHLWPQCGVAVRQGWSLCHPFILLNTVGGWCSGPSYSRRVTVSTLNKLEVGGAQPSLVFQNSTNQEAGWVGELGMWVVVGGVLVEILIVRQAKKLEDLAVQKLLSNVLVSSPMRWKSEI